MPLSLSGGRGAAEFPSTAHSLLRVLQNPQHPEYRQQLGRLISLYWRPVYCVIRHSSAKSSDDARDLTQDFFLTVVLGGNLLALFSPDRGSFRALLRTAVRNFMNKSFRDAAREKRGGDVYTVSLDDETRAWAEQIAADRNLEPERVFDLAWNHVVLTEAIARLEQKLTTEGRASAFKIFRSYDLELGRTKQSYTELGAALGLSEAQVRHALTHARATFRAVLVDIVADYVEGPVALAAELRALTSG